MDDPCDPYLYGLCGSGSAKGSGFGSGKPSVVENMAANITAIARNTLIWKQEKTYN